MKNPTLLTLEKVLVFNGVLSATHCWELQDWMIMYQGQGIEQGFDHFI